MLDIHHTGQCKPQAFAGKPLLCRGAAGACITCALLLCPHSSAQRRLPLGALEDAQGSARRRLPRICSSWGSGGHQGKHPQLQRRRGWGARWSKDHCYVTIKRGLVPHRDKENAFCALSSVFVLLIQPWNWQMNYLDEGACFLSRDKCLSIFNLSWSQWSWVHVDNSL